MQAHSLECLEEIFTCPLPLTVTAAKQDPNATNFYPASCFLQSINSTVHRRARLLIIVVNKLNSLLDFARVTHASFERTIKENMAFNSILDLVGSARTDYVLADRFHSGIRWQASCLITPHTGSRCIYLHQQCSCRNWDYWILCWCCSMPFPSICKHWGWPSNRSWGTYILTCVYGFNLPRLEKSTSCESSVDTKA
jgi:hypothetical protein